MKNFKSKNEKIKLKKMGNLKKFEVFEKCSISFKFDKF